MIWIGVLPDIETIAVAGPNRRYEVRLTVAMGTQAEVQVHRIMRPAEPAAILGLE